MTYGARLKCRHLSACVVPAFAAMMTSCGGDESKGGRPPPEPYDGPLLAADCDPIGVHCGMPFPSDVYLETDPTGKNPSGKSIRFGATTLPKTQGITPVDPAILYDMDGWSQASGPMTYMPGATALGLANPSMIATTLSVDSPTIILNADTGELVPHWVDIDESVRNADQKAIMLRPAVLLDNATHYIVAMRGVVDTKGNAVAPTEVFRALRDDTEHPDPSVASRRYHYYQLFQKLDAAGIERDNLQIAWDFTTASIDGVTGPMLKVRDAALAAVGPDGPEYVVTSVEDAPNEYIKQRFILTATVPSFLSSTTYAGGDPAPRLVFDENGNPVQQGTMGMDVLVQIPNAVDTGQKLGILQNGHGLFGSKSEGQNGYLAVASSYGYVTISVDLFGFSGADIPMAAEALSSRPELLRSFVDRQIQGMVNQLLAMRMMIGRVARDGILGDGVVHLDSAQIDPTVRAYRGDSQGGIMGGTYMSISTDVTRGVLGEPGTPYSLLLNRSNDWPLYGGILGGSYADDRDIQIMIGLIQLAWDRSEPSGFVRHMNGATLRDTPSHDVLLHAALGDQQVYTGGAHIMARAVGARLVESNDPAELLIREVWGLETAAPPLESGSALVEWDFNLAPEPLTNIPPTDGCDPHDRVRQLLPAYQQQDVFIRTGRIEWFCDGVCNCDGLREEQGCADTLCQ